MEHGEKWLTNLITRFEISRDGRKKARRRSISSGRGKDTFPLIRWGKLLELGDDWVWTTKKNEEEDVWVLTGWSVTGSVPIYRRPINKCLPLEPNNLKRLSPRTS